jgi:hypothetical protein
VKKTWIWVCVGVVVLLGAGAAVWYFTQSQQEAPQESAEAPASAPAPQVAVAPPAASEPAIKYPIEAASQPIAAPGDFQRVLDELFGQKAVATLFETQDFAHRLVATVDNLGRSQASSRLWPVKPAGGRFTVEGRDDSKTIGADNGARYTPYVLLFENVNMNALAVQYVRSYPMLQQAYEELGFPGHYFNDRMVQVIDQLLATPDPGSPVKIHLPTLGGEVQTQRPWVLYEFDDSSLQALSSGQKLLLRMGPVNERRIKAKLTEFRRLIAAGPPPR